MFGVKEASEKHYSMLLKGLHRIRKIIKTDFGFQDRFISFNFLAVSSLDGFGSGKYRFAQFKKNHAVSHVSSPRAKSYEGFKHDHLICSLTRDSRFNLEARGTLAWKGQSCFERSSFTF